MNYQVQVLFMIEPKGVYLLMNIFLNAVKSVQFSSNFPIHFLSCYDFQVKMISNMTTLFHYLDYKLF